MTDTPVPVKAKDSASVLIIRDGETHADYGSLQILMVKRHRNIKFAGGAYVFPGGKLDAADRALEESEVDHRGDKLPEAFRGLRYAALREIFEETGLLVGTKRGQAINESERKVIDENFRTAILERKLNLKEFQDQASIALGLGQCIPFAHWITPEAYPIRFNTRFFLCQAPVGQIPSPDGQEITALDWMHPMQLVEESKGILMFPTMMNLKKLGQAKTVDEALKLLADREIVTVMPEVVTGEKARFRKIPDDAGYEDVDQSRTRTAINPDQG